VKILKTTYKLHKFNNNNQTNIGTVWLPQAWIQQDRHSYIISGKITTWPGFWKQNKIGAEKWEDTNSIVRNIRAKFMCRDFMFKLL